MSNKTPQEGFTNGGQTPAYGNEKTWQQILYEKDNVIARLQVENDMLKAKISEIQDEYFLSATQWDKKEVVYEKQVLKLQERIQDLEFASTHVTDINAGDIPTPSKGQETKEEGE